MTNEEKINELCNVIETLVDTICYETLKCENCILQCRGKQIIIDAITEIKEAEA